MLLARFIYTEMCLLSLILEINWQVVVLSSLTEWYQEGIAGGLKDDCTIISSHCSCWRYLKPKRSKRKDYVIDVYSIDYLTHIYVHGFICDVVWNLFSASRYQLSVKVDSKEIDYSIFCQVNVCHYGHVLLGRCYL